MKYILIVHFSINLVKVKNDLKSEMEGVIFRCNNKACFTCYIWFMHQAGSTAFLILRVATNIIHINKMILYSIGMRLFNNNANNIYHIK